MTTTTGDVRRWLDAGVVDAATADRILAFEAGATAGDSRRERAGPSITEFLVYLAAAIVGVGVTVLVATNWEHLGLLPRLLIPGVSALIALVAGQSMRGSAQASMARAGSAAWLLATALATGTVAIAAHEAGWHEENVALAAAVTAVALAVTLWALSPVHAQLVGLAAAFLLLSLAFTARASGDSGPTILGISLAAFAAAALVATEAGILVPRLTAQLLASAGLALGAFYSGLPPGPALAALVALVASVGLVTASLRFNTLLYMIFAVLIAFAGLVTAILRHIDDTTLAALALIAVGLALLVALAVIARTRPWSRARQAPAGGPVPATAGKLPR